MHSLLVGFDGSVPQTKTHKHKFLRMCYLQSKCRHPNIVQFIGIYHHGTSEAIYGEAPGQIPTVVMERMDCNLRTLIEQNTASLHNVLSLLHDISLGVWYIHNCNPPVIHCDLTPTSILVNTTSMVAKIAGFDAALEGYEGDEPMPGGIHFMLLEAFERPAIYGLLLDVFTYGGTSLFAVVGEWPELSQSMQIDPNTGREKVFSEVERRLQHLNKMTKEAAVLRPLVEECLNNDPARRPTMEVVSDKIKEIKINYMERHPEIKVIRYFLFTTLDCCTGLLHTWTEYLRALMCSYIPIAIAPMHDTNVLLAIKLYSNNWAWIILAYIAFIPIMQALVGVYHPNSNLVVLHTFVLNTVVGINKEFVAFSV